MIHFGLAVEVVRRLPPSGSIPLAHPLPPDVSIQSGFHAFPELSHLPRPSDGVTLFVNEAPVAVIGWQHLRRRARIRPLYAIPSARGRGFAVPLMLRALRSIAAQGATEAFYDVAWHNRASRATAYRCGFRDARGLLVLNVAGLDLAQPLNAFTHRIVQLTRPPCEE